MAVLVVGDYLFVLKIGYARIEHYIIDEVYDLLELFELEVEYEPYTAGHAAEVPYVRDGRGELDMTHALAADLRRRDFDAALIADDTLSLSFRVW